MSELITFDELVNKINNPDELKIMIDSDQFHPEIFYMKNDNGWTAFMIACQYNHQSVQCILDHDKFTPDMINVFSDNKWTAFMIACKYNHQSVQCILDHDKFTSDMIDVSDDDGWTPFMIACQFNHQSVQCVLNHDKFTSDMLNFSYDGGWTAFMIACQCNHQSVECILNHCKFTSDMLNKKTTDGRTPLMIACQYNHQSVQCILNHDKFTADMLNLKNNNGLTPLMIACKSMQNYDVIKKMIEKSCKNTLKRRCYRFNVFDVESNNPMKRYVTSVGQTFLHILAIFNPKIFCQIKNTIDLYLFNILDNSNLSSFQYLPIDENCSLKYKPSCPICFNDSHHTYAFNPCGHTICNHCLNSYDKSICYVCRQSISSKIKLYL